MKAESGGFAKARDSFASPSPAKRIGSSVGFGFSLLKEAVHQFGERSNKENTLFLTYLQEHGERKSELAESARIFLQVQAGLRRKLMASAKTIESAEEGPGIVETVRKLKERGKQARQTLKAQAEVHRLSLQTLEKILTAKIGKLRRSLEEPLRKAATRLSALEGLARKNAELKASLAQALEAPTSSTKVLAMEVEALRKENSKLKDKIEADAFRSPREEPNAPEPKIPEIEPKAKAQELKNKALELKIRELELNNRELENRSKELDGKIRELEDKKKDLEDKNKELDSRAKNLLTQSKISRSEKQELEAKVKNLTKKLEEISAQRDSLLNEIEQTKSLLRTLPAEMDEAIRKLNEELSSREKCEDEVAGNLEKAKMIESRYELLKLEKQNFIDLKSQLVSSGSSLLKRFEQLDFFSRKQVSFGIRKLETLCESLEPLMHIRSLDPNRSHEIQRIKNELKALASKKESPEPQLLCFDPPEADRSLQVAQFPIILSQSILKKEGFDSFARPKPSLDLKDFLIISQLRDSSGRQGSDGSSKRFDFQNIDSYFSLGKASLSSQTRVLKPDSNFKALLQHSAETLMAKSPEKILEFENVPIFFFEKKEEEKRNEFSLIETHKLLLGSRKLLTKVPLSLQNIPELISSQQSQTRAAYSLSRSETFQLLSKKKEEGFAIQPEPKILTTETFTLISQLGSSLPRLEISNFTGFAKEGRKSIEETPLKELGFSSLGELAGQRKISVGSGRELERKAIELKGLGEESINPVKLKEIFLMDHNYSFLQSRQFAESSSSFEVEDLPELILRNPGVRDPRNFSIDGGILVFQWLRTKVPELGLFVRDERLLSQLTELRRELSDAMQAKLDLQAEFEESRRKSENFETENRKLRAQVQELLLDPHLSGSLLPPGLLSPRRIDGASEADRLARLARLEERVDKLRDLSGVLLYSSPSLGRLAQKIRRLLKAPEAIRQTFEGQIGALKEERNALAMQVDRVRAEGREKDARARRAAEQLATTKGNTRISEVRAENSKLTVELEILSQEVESLRADKEMLLATHRESAKLNGKIINENSAEITALRLQVAELTETNEKYAESALQLAAFHQQLEKITDTQFSARNLPDIEASLTRFYKADKALEIVEKHLRGMSLNVPRASLPRRLIEIINDWNLARNNSHISANSSGLEDKNSETIASELKELRNQNEKLFSALQELKTNVKNSLLLFFANAKRKIDNQSAFRDLASLLSFSLSDRENINEILRTQVAVGPIELTDSTVF